jgi:hypothetical protein
VIDEVSDVNFAFLRGGGGPTFSCQIHRILRGSVVASPGAAKGNHFVDRAKVAQFTFISEQ